MSFLNNNNSEFLSAKITKRGRNAIAKGNFQIKYFQIGDSEFDYTSPYTGLTGIGSISGQKVFSPFDIESGVKYPLGYDSSITTTLGTPQENSSTETIRNVMGPAGFVSNYIPFDTVTPTGSTVESYSEQINITSLNGTSSINVISGNTFQECEYITVVFGGFVGANSIISGNSNSMIYRITGITGNTLYLDRNTVNLSSLSGYANIICNKSENEYNACEDIDFTGQLNPWTLNVVWGGNTIQGQYGKPIGGDYPVSDENLTGYTSNVYVSTKELLGYTSTGQTFETLTGGTIDTFTSTGIGTSYKNSFNDEIELEPKEQRCVAIIHYSELGSSLIDPDRFFKYDDYISYDEDTLDTVALNNDGDDISDAEYFEIYIPFIYYHRNTGTTLGALFTMDTENFYIRSTKNSSHELLFRYLLDEQNNKVGKIFPHNKTIVFDDQELVALLDYRSNRRYTLPSPRVVPVPSDSAASDSFLSGTTGQTVWVTYGFEYTSGTTLNSLPCNYFNNVKLESNASGCTITSASNIGIKFGSNSFSNMYSGFTGFKNGFIADKFFALVQVVDTSDTDDLPDTGLWRKIDLTSSIPNHTSGLINSDNLEQYTFTIKYSAYTGASIFDLETHMSGLTSDYLLSTTGTTEPQFGDEQPFPGSVRVVRASDLEVMNFQVNLPSGTFTKSQNPTYVSGYPKITDITLLDSNRDTLVVAKTAVPVTRTGTQTFSIKLDF